MQKHTKNYLKHFNYWEHDFIPCEICWKQAVDLHHIVYRSQWWGDEVENIIALCREDHKKAHDNYYTNRYLQNIHNLFLNR